MNAAIAELIRAKIEPLSFAGKVAGLVRPITRMMGPAGQMKPKTFPVGCDVEDPLACDEKTFRDLVPSGQYMSIIYFEDRGAMPKRTRPQMGRWYTSKLRLVCWMDTKKIGEVCTIGSSVQEEVQAAIEVAGYNSDQYIGIRHRVSGIAPKSPAIFSQYTYDEVNRQFLHWPFDYFGLDIDTDFRLNMNCVQSIVPEETQC